MIYVYNERSWLKSINNIINPGTKKLAEEIHYNVTDLGGAVQYNGNIAAVKFYNAGVSSAPHLGYRFSYDGANRLTKAETYMGAGWSSTNNYRLPEITYDLNGNIMTLHRNNESGNPLDRFTYAYQSNKNRLASITNSVTSQTYNYGYDNNGNVTSDQYRGINNISNILVTFLSKVVKGGSTINYWYDNNGNRFRKQESSLDEVYVLGVNGETEAVFDINGTAKFFNILAGGETIGRFIAGAPVNLYLSNTTLSGTYEAQNSITVEDNVAVSGPTTLRAGNSIKLKPGFSAPSGIDFTAKIGVVPNTPKRFYYLKDHLGSIRVVVNETGNIVSSDDYDPWGMILNGRSTNTAYSNAKYKFTGKERDVETGYDYFSARYYDSRIARWLQVDPVFRKYPSWSPYNYTLGNPIKFFDPDGLDVIISKSLWEYNSKNLNFQNYALNSVQFKRMVALFGKGGVFSHINVTMNLDMNGISGVTRFSINNSNALDMSIKQGTAGILTLPKDVFSNMSEISINPEHFLYNWKTIDHEISHFAYNAGKLLENATISDLVRMAVGSTQDNYLRNHFTQGMTSNEIISAILKVYLENGKTFIDETDIKSIEDIEEIIEIKED
jgi:RHS repeat-associated protein